MLSPRVAFSDGGGEQADRGGAIAEIAEKPFGAVLLWLPGISLVGMTLWRLTEAAFGQAGPDRVWSATKPGIGWWRVDVGANRHGFLSLLCERVSLSHSVPSRSRGGSWLPESDDVRDRCLRATFPSSR
ncbi:DUF1206 domain-containing protein [Streptomyces sp. NBC_01474]|uniref:DUF1206 domain-containing protein n=1 Tax=Streptomyces sp. NBC_01474 TaxID=2903880 RepID=UPI002DDA3DA4|nr:DUF1206 domain-containing protein [Streptomyces sp. NBC_01474]WSE00911.1 DUF1206 domain-containing protein [Streptomyces sp. NBC_01474]